MIVIQKPKKSAYVGSEEVLEILDKLNATDQITSVGVKQKNCKVEGIAKAMKAKKIIYAGTVSYTHLDVYKRQADGEILKFMEIVILSFTDAGCQMACKVRENFIQSGYRVKVYTLTRFCRLYGFHAFPEDKKSWIGSLWGEKALLFIGAAGIAVRMIAPHVKDKFTDSPVLVMDEKGSYVIPLLSGHVGGAVELSLIHI